MSAPAPVAVMNGRAILAWNIRRLRGERGLSQESLATDAGIDRAYVSEIERQEGNATIDIMDRVARSLGVELAELVKVPDSGDAVPHNLRPGRRGAASRT